MRINKIELCNFGSYAGINTFEIQNSRSKKRNIVLIGGKNGAGKTTLFDGIKLCLYGHKAEGFQTINAFYRKDVKKIFNDMSKFESGSECYIKLSFEISNGQDEDIYEIKRSWNIYSGLLDEFERFEVIKNRKILSEEELGDFDNFLMNLIPPELFELFFFDGEQIADFFLDENGNERLKNAFMILCGYDTFDIMEKNFKRLLFGKKVTNGQVEINYSTAKDAVQQLENEIANNKVRLKDLKDEFDALNSEIATSDKRYKQGGGVLYEEWNEKFLKIKEEERLREDRNGYLKRMANDFIPYIIVKDNLEKLKSQLQNEHDKQQMEALQKSLKLLLPNVMKKVYDRLDWKSDDELTDLVIEEFDAEIFNKELDKIDNILCASNEDFDSLIRAINIYLSVEKEEIVNAQNDVKESIIRSQKLREEIEKCNIEGIQTYIDKKTSLLETKSQVSVQMQNETDEIESLARRYDEAIQILKREEKKFEDEVKTQSIGDLAERSIAFLDSLQKKLYVNEIAKVEILFIEKIKELARKSNFIDEIKIDNDFNIHIYKNITFNSKKVCKRIHEIGNAEYLNEYGQTHCQSILNVTKTSNLDEFVIQYGKTNEDFSVLQEIDKSRLSKGEKQVFIMALYWSFMHLNQHEVPFIIDTPFARIDSEHRTNITRKFFMDLNGQVFIFSTNEEINGEHLKIMDKNIQSTFLLENTDNRRTNVIENKYFGE
ncbi:MAG: AAA family ATPase [Lachnotalea sp.]